MPTNPTDRRWSQKVKIFELEQLESFEGTLQSGAWRVAHVIPLPQSRKVLFVLEREEVETP